MARFWYGYNGTGDPLLASSYNLAALPPLCSSGCRICAIYTLGAATPSAPLSQNIRTYIATGMIRGVAQPEGPSGTVTYFFLRNC